MQDMATTSEAPSHVNAVEPSNDNGPDIQTDDVDIKKLAKGKERAIEDSEMDCDNEDNKENEKSVSKPAKKDKKFVPVHGRRKKSGNKESVAKCMGINRQLPWILYKTTLSSRFISRRRTTGSDTERIYGRQTSS